MPQPYKTSTYSRPSKCLLRRPDCAVFIAAIATEWSYVEDNMVLLLSGTLGSHSIDDQGAAQLGINWVAAETLAAAETIRIRLKMIDATLGKLLQEYEPLSEEWISLKARLNSRSRERNIVVHANWALTDDLPNDLLLVDRSSINVMRYTAKDFEDILNRISDVRVECYEFMLKVLEAQRSGRLRSV